MIYLVCGLDSQTKDKRIADLKNKIFPSNKNITLDFEVLSASKLPLQNLKRAMTTLPVLAEKRFILIRQAEQLQTEHRQLIADLLEKTKDFLILLLDLEDAKAAENLKKQFVSSLEILYFEKGLKRNIFDFTRCIVQNKKCEALKQLSEFIDDGVHPLKIMPTIVWEWKKNKERLGSLRFQEGLLALQQADLNIKRSRLSSRQALEVLVVKLCSLAA